VDLKKNFARLHHDSGKKAVIQELKAAAAKEADAVYLAPTPTARARPSARTCAICWREERNSSRSPSTKSPATRYARPLRAPGELDALWSTRSRRAAFSTAWSGYQVSPCSGTG